MSQGDDAGGVNRIALSFSSDLTFSLTNEHLNTARRMGINLFETNRPEMLESLNTDSFYLLLVIDQKYQTASRLSQEWRKIAANAIKSYQRSETIFPGRIVALNLFQYPDDRNDRFFEFSGLIADTLYTVTDLPLYYKTHVLSSVDIFMPYRFKSVNYSNELPVLGHSGNVISFSPSDHLAESILSLESLFEAVNETSEPVIIIPAEWFFHLLDQYPEMDLIFTAFINGEFIPFPLPEVPDTFPNLNLPVLLLMVIWSVFIVLYRFRPLLFDKCVRYFTSHKFFVQDVIQNRNRSLADGIYLLLLHSLASAFFFYTLVLILFGSAGLSVLSEHYSFLFIENYETFTFLILGFALSSLLHTISIFWLFLFNKYQKRISQIVNLYSWGFILNLILATVLVFNYLFGWGTSWALGFTLVYFLVWFFSFNIAAVNSVRYMESFKIPYILLTIGLHLAIIIALITFMIMDPHLIETLSLAHWISI